ncbi:MAG: Sec-independent protein translocase protein TatB [Lamprobacter sp.]|uniref:Sec-independent protein translocase protein TatB n=1 Tax=Lamprobacter sp. TaxID=3100796 RepID=UPI002B2607EC|nr:Sec-independent protein translocase protein TatB [Lamprobacter sp.]MEA3641576.1 Sec-independent protein translocase protein TatB [Lamprobacter sp.]
MFDVGALELLVISVVALIVVGPERLPKLARTAGLWVGRARRAFSSVKSEIDREIKADELKEILRKQAESRPLEAILEEAVTGRSASKASAPGGSRVSAAGSAPEAGSSAGSETGSNNSGPDRGPDKRSAAAETPQERS